MLQYGSFRPSSVLANCHIQTILPAVFKKSLLYPTSNERLELPDGDFLDLVWIGLRSDRIVVLLHGLEGSIESHYIATLGNSLVKNNYQCVLMHFRGCSGESNRLLRAYHSGDTQDLAFVINTLKKRYANAFIAVVGVSLGGNVVLKWLGESGVNNPVNAAAAVSVPFDLEKAADRLNRGVSKLYQYYLLKSLRNSALQKLNRFDAEFDAQSLRKVKSIREFDNLVTAPVHGFDNALHYYKTCSCKQYLTNVKKPTLILHSLDDPFMTADVVPKESEISEFIELEVSNKGGHVGFICGTLPWKTKAMYAERIPQFIDKYI